MSLKIEEIQEIQKVYIRNCNGVFLHQREDGLWFEYIDGELIFDGASTRLEELYQEYIKE